MCQPHSRARAHIRVHGQFKLDLTGFCCFVLFVFKEECTELEGSGKGGYLCEVLMGVKMIKYIVQDP